MSTRKAEQLARAVISAAAVKGLHVCTVESCTGGLIAGCLTDVAGSSSVFEGGLVTYSNESKQFLAGVDPATLRAHGAVSGETAREMAEGAIAAFGGMADFGVSVTGIAGPGGGTVEKPVGLVWFGIAGPKGTRTERRVFPPGSRQFIRERTVETALSLLLHEISGV